MIVERISPRQCAPERNRGGMFVFPGMVRAALAADVHQVVSRCDALLEIVPD